MFGMKTGWGERWLGSKKWAPLLLTLLVAAVTAGARTLLAIDSGAREARSSSSQPRSSAAGMASTGRASPNRRTARTRIIRYHSTVRGDAPSAALAAQNRSVAAPSPIGTGPKESSEVPDGPEVSGEQTGE